LAGVLALALIVAGVLLDNATRPAPLRPLMSLNIDLDDNTPLATGSRGGLLALSPDGTRLALTLRDADGKVRLHTRLLNQSQVTPLAGTENATYPFFSPDGDWVGFFADAKLKKISDKGGAAVTLCDTPVNSRGASWGDDGNIIASLGPFGGLSRIPSAGGTPVAVGADDPPGRLQFGSANDRTHCLSSFTKRPPREFHFEVDHGPATTAIGMAKPRTGFGIDGEGVAFSLVQGTGSPPLSPHLSRPVSGIT